MHIKKSLSEHIFMVIVVIILTALMVVCLYPILHILAASLSMPSQMATHRGLLLFPKGFTLESYGMVFENPMIFVSYMNTIIYVVAGTALNLLLTTFAAYALSRRQNPVRNIVMFIITFTMFFSGGLVPTYLLMHSLNLQDTRWVMIIPGAVNAYNLIIMKTSFAEMPVALEESAKIDGANDFIVLFKIFAPLAKPVIAVMTLFYGVGHWNEWFNASLYIMNRELLPLQVILREILILNSTQNMITSASTTDKVMVAETVKYATIVVATLPILALYPFLQKYFVKGVMIGSIKG